MVERCRWSRRDVIAKASQLKNLLNSYGPALEHRVGREAIDFVSEGNHKLWASSLVQADRQNEKTATRQIQCQSVDAAIGFLLARRGAIRAQFRRDKGTRDSFGLSVRLRRSSIHTVTGAYEVFVSAAEAEPEKARAAGIADEDIVEMRRILAALEDGEQSHGGKKLSAKASTAARNELQLELEAAIEKIVRAAAMTFADRPEVVMLFKSALPKRISRRQAPETQDELVSVEEKSEQPAVAADEVSTALVGGRDVDGA
jgi:hypothetical protein